MSNKSAVSGVISKDLKSICYMNQVKVQPNTEGSPVFGIQRTVIDESRQVYRSTNKEDEAPLIELKR